MPSSADETHQLVVDAQAFGDGHEAKHVVEVIESVDKRMRKLDPKLDVFASTVVTADTHFRRRDPRINGKRVHIR